MTKYYDVCNDYSLDACDSTPDNISLYAWSTGMVRGVVVKIGRHKKHDEIHYVKTESALDLTGAYL